MTTPAQLEHLDPRQLQEHPRNARTDLGDLTGLTASIKAQGVLEPLVVAPMNGGGHVVLFGHRRRAASIEAGRDTVPCIVRDDLMAVSDADLIDQLGGMLSENVHRQDLNPVEEARAVRQMLDLGVSLTKVAAKTGLTKAHVTKAAGVGHLDDDTAAAVAAGGLDLEQAAVVATYRDDPTVAADLVEKAAQGPGVFMHAVGRAKADRERRAEFLAKETELRDAGRILVETAEWNGPTNRRVVSLDRADGSSRLTAAEHLTCPGAAVRLSESPNDGVLVLEVCTDWKANGHQDPYLTSSSKPPVADLPPEQREAARVERAQLIEDNKAMAAANTVRRQWIRGTLLERRRGEKDVLRFAVEALHTHRDAVRSWFDWGSTEDHNAVAAQLGLSKPGSKLTRTLTSGDDVTDARLPLQLLAHVAAAVECTFTRDAHRATGELADQLAGWLAFLVDQGYALSEIEQRLVDAAARRNVE